MALEDMNPMQGVSGPGKFAKRTDLQYQSPEYGAGVAMQQQMAGAPMASSPDVRGATPTDVRAAAAGANVTPLFAPSERPQEPITSGIDMGAGPGSDALMMNQIEQSDSDIVAKYLPSLDAMAQAPDTPQSFRAFVRYLQGSL